MRNCIDFSLYFPFSFLSREQNLIVSHNEVIEFGIELLITATILFLFFLCTEVVYRTSI